MRFLLPALALLCLPLGAGAQTVARFGAVELSAGDLQRLIESQPAEVRTELAGSPEALDRVVRSELVRKRVLEEARAKGWDRRPEVVERAERAREQAIVASYVNSLARPPAEYPPEAEIAAFYEANKQRFVQPRQLRVAQIYLRRPADPVLAEEAGKRAAALARQAQAPGADFATLARQSSEHAESAPRGGELGWVAETALLPEVRRALQGVAPGAVAGPVATPEGWHIVRLIEAKDAAPAALADVRPAIVNALRLRRAQELEAKYLDELIAKTPPTFDQPALEKLRAALR
jgi:peptidylprolyl isomerase